MSSNTSTHVQPDVTIGWRKRATYPVYAVTLFNCDGSRPLHLSVLADSEPDEVSQAQPAQSNLLEVAPARSSKGIKLTRSVRITESPRPDEHLRRARQDDAVAVQHSVAEANPTLLRLLIKARTVELRPALTWSPRFGWLTIEAGLQATNAAERMRGLNLVSPFLRLAAELIALCLPFALQATTRHPFQMGEGGRHGRRRWRLPRTPCPATFGTDPFPS